MADRDGHQVFSFSEDGGVGFNYFEICFEGATAQFHYMAIYTLFDTLPDLSVAFPGKIEAIKKLAKLVVIHKLGS
ncbi:MAG: hypothetical protein HQ589_04725 [Syntrophaceae bacterium]|nr:hypothetical protein [Syntrophaceae bacterium]